MKPCPFCKKPLPDKATTCIGCGQSLTAPKGVTRPSPPKRTTTGSGPSATQSRPAKQSVRPAAASGSSTTEKKRPPGPPGKVGVDPGSAARPASPAGGTKSIAPRTPASEKGDKESTKGSRGKRPSTLGSHATPPANSLEEKAVQLEAKVKRRKLIGWMLAGAAAAAILIGAFAAWSYYRASVLSYAELEQDVRIERDPVFPDRLTLYYRPASKGKLGFRRTNEDRETELFDQVVPGEEDKTLEWRWPGVKKGDVIRVTHRDGMSLTTAKLPVPEVPPLPVPPYGVQGEVVNAVNNQPVPAAEVRIVGTRFQSQADQEGKFHLKHDITGPASIEVTADGFSTDQFELELDESETDADRLVISPGMKQGQIRIVLTWGDEPQDLDLHLEGPLPNEERFHVYFGEKGDLESKEYVNLDIDDRDGQGPETITVLGVLQGRYHCFVHDYTNADKLESRALAESDAVVRVLYRGQTYRFRADGESTGNKWHICDIDVSDDGADIQRLDTYESVLMEKGGEAGTVVLLIDTSGSMSSLIGDAKQACLGFLGAIPFETGASAGLATFGSSGRKLQDITTDREVLKNAIRPLSTRGNTAMAQGLQVAHQMLKDVSGSRTVMLFTDGKPNDEGLTLQQGNLLKADDINIWAIGTAGADISFLRRLASKPEQATFASPTDLKKVFGETAGKIYAPIQRE